MKSSLLFYLTLWFPLFGSYAPERHNLQSPATQPRQEQVEHFLCPAVTIDCPDAVMQGVPVRFSAKIRGAGDAPSLTLTWSVSAGTIISGQTQHISKPDSIADMTVDTTGVPGNTTVTATAEVTGLPRSCEVQSSCRTVVRPAIGDPTPIDEYGNIKFSDERARLDNFAIELQRDPTASGYILCYGGRRGRRGEAAARCERAKKYLVGRRAIDARRLVTVDGGFREDLTVVLWIMPPGVKATPGPTVDPGEVQFIEGPRKARGRSVRRHRAGV